MALSAKMDSKGHMVMVLVGDGECYEGSVWEAAMFASHHQLNNLIVIVDRNEQCVTDFTEDCNQLNPFGDKWKHLIGMLKRLMVIPLRNCLMLS